MMDYFDSTPLVHPIVNWALIAPYDTKRNPIQLSRQTHSARSQDNPYDLFALSSVAQSPTAVVNNIVNDFPSRQHAVNRSVYTTAVYASQRDDFGKLDRIANQRVKLMAVKYASGAASAEVLARLEILNSRLLDISPRVLPEQVDALESDNEKLMRVRATRLERAKRLGITA